MSDPIPPPTAGRPADVPHLLSQAVSDGDLDAAAALYESMAVLVLWNDTTAMRPAQIRSALSSVLAAKVPLRREPGDVCVVGSHAMLTGRWNMRGSGPDLTPHDLAGWQHSLVRRSLRGDWRFLIDCWTLENSLVLPLAGRLQTIGSDDGQSQAPHP